MNTLFGNCGFIYEKYWCWGKYADNLQGPDGGLTQTWDSKVLMQLKSDTACEIHEQILNKVDKVLKDVQADPTAWEVTHIKAQ